MDNTKSNAEREMMRFAALNPVVVTNIVEPTEVQLRGRDYVGWGDDNAYPDYLLDLYRNVPTLRTIINGSVDYAAGDEVTAAGDWERAMNKRGDSARDLVRLLARDWYTYGGFALQVIRDALGGVAELYHTDIRYLRANKEGDVFYYSEHWGAKNLRSDRVLVYPAFMEGADHPNSILYIKDARTQVYPAPLYAASVKACEIERSIDEYHLNEINNGFAPSVMINFNNGRPTDDIKDEIERSVQEKFAGKNNAGRIMLSWNDGVATRTTIDQFSVQDYGAKYESLAKHSRQQIFTAFRANPNLFGIPTESLGFSEEEYQQAFKLYNRTQVQPVQRMIVDAFDRVLGVKNSITIVPFSLEGAGEDAIK